jgi:hypothetical protein
MKFFKSKGDGFVKSYVMLRCGTVTENNFKLFESPTAALRLIPQDLVASRQVRVPCIWNFLLCRPISDFLRGHQGF